MSHKYDSTQDKSKKRIALVSLGAPTGRREVEILAKWLEEMMNDLENQKEESNSAHYHKQCKTVYNFALLELVRQVKFSFYFNYISGFCSMSSKR